MCTEVMVSFATDDFSSGQGCDSSHNKNDNEYHTLE